LADGAELAAPRFEGTTADGFHATLNSYDAGMVGFVNSLIDNVGSPSPDNYASTLASMTVWAGVVKLIKVG
jgi:hypothetical protein